MKKLLITFVVSLVLTGSGTCFAAHPAAAEQDAGFHPVKQKTSIQRLSDCQGEQCFKRTTVPCCQQVSSSAAPARNSIQQKYKKNKHKTGKVFYKDPKERYQSLQTVLNRRTATYLSTPHQSFTGIMKAVQRRE
ncbi:MAG: hypothetical protein R3B71_01175 [Candidatus Gracilibacteria bacterium]|nr:hypothetical protein [Candidatus Peregrinibacteria bacterium]